MYLWFYNKTERSVDKDSLIFQVLRETQGYEPEVITLEKYQTDDFEVDPESDIIFRILDSLDKRYRVCEEDVTLSNDTKDYAAKLADTLKYEWLPFYAKPVEVEEINVEAWLVDKGNE